MEFPPGLQAASQWRARPDIDRLANWIADLLNCAASRENVGNRGRSQPRSLPRDYRQVPGPGLRSPPPGAAGVALLAAGVLQQAPRLTKYQNVSR